MNTSLHALGLTPSVESAFHPFHAQGLVLGRVAAEHRGGYSVFLETSIVAAEILGRLRHASSSRDDLPAVGDWVACRSEPGASDAIIHAVLPRASALRRGLAGGTTEAQIVAANVDLVFLVSALDRDLNPRRIERYLAATSASGAEPIVVLTKADACVDRDAMVDDVRAAAGGARILVTSSVTGEGLAELRRSFAGDRTGALVGSSGVGKSSLANALLDANALATGDVSGDGRGRHTTTHRELVLLPTGGVLIDTPGMRELRLFDEVDLEASFDDVAALALECRFRDCAHEDEPDCKVREALDEDRYRSYHKLKRELATLAVRKDARARAEQKKHFKALARSYRARDRK